MSSIGYISTNNKYSDIERFSSESVQSKLERIDAELKDFPTILNPDTLMKLKDGEYEITLKEYNDLSTYRTTMTALYGNSSASKFPSVLNNIFATKEDLVLSAKDFMEKMEEKGIKKENALKLYTAFKSYSVMNTYLGFNNSYITAVV